MKLHLSLVDYILHLCFSVGDKVQLEQYKLRSVLFLLEYTFKIVHFGFVVESGADIRHFNIQYFGLIIFNQYLLSHDAIKRFQALISYL